MSEDEFYQTTPRAFANKIKGFERYEETQVRERWEMHRELIVTVLTPHLEKKYKKKSLKEMYPLKWDLQPKNITAKTPKDYWSQIDKKKGK